MNGYIQKKTKYPCYNKGCNRETEGRWENECETCKFKATQSMLRRQNEKINIDDSKIKKAKAKAAENQKKKLVKATKELNTLKQQLRKDLRELELRRDLILDNKPTKIGQRIVNKITAEILKQEAKIAKCEKEIFKLLEIK